MPHSHGPDKADHFTKAGVAGELISSMVGNLFWGISLAAMAGEREDRLSIIAWCFSGTLALLAFGAAYCHFELNRHHQPRKASDNSRRPSMIDVAADTGATAIPAANRIQLAASEASASATALIKKPLLSNGDTEHTTETTEAYAERKKEEIEPLPTTTDDAPASPDTDYHPLNSQETMTAVQVSIGLTGEQWAEILADIATELSSNLKTKKTYTLQTMLDNLEQAMREAAEDESAALAPKLSKRQCGALFADAVTHIGEVSCAINILFNVIVDSALNYNPPQYAFIIAQILIFALSTYCSAANVRSCRDALKKNAKRTAALERRALKQEVYPNALIAPHLRLMPPPRRNRSDSAQSLPDLDPTHRA